ncbi:MAG: phasin family protein [Rubrobacteraceae bacterium]
MRGTFGETLERLVLLQVGAAAATRKRVERAVEDLIAQGRVERAEGRTLVNEVMGRTRERSEGARSLVDASVQQSLRGVGVPTREDYEDLIFRVEQLEHRVRVLESGDVEPEPPVAGDESTAPETPDDPDTEQST